MSVIKRRLLQKITKQYLLGLLPDATERQFTYRIGQKNKELIESVAKGIRSFNKKAWVYKEGRNRNLWIVEFAKRFLKNTQIKSRQNKIDYIRGYFDAEGGITP
jgi:hypothetical protein